MALRLFSKNYHLLSGQWRKALETVSKRGWGQRKKRRYQLESVKTFSTGGALEATCGANPRCPCQEPRSKNVPYESTIMRRQRQQRERMSTFWSMSDLHKFRKKMMREGKPIEPARVYFPMSLGEVTRPACGCLPPPGQCKPCCPPVMEIPGRAVPTFSPRQPCPQFIPAKPLYRVKNNKSTHSSI